MSAGLQLIYAAIYAALLPSVRGMRTPFDRARRYPAP
jgi:hypothetical protein